MVVLLHVANIFLCLYCFDSVLILFCNARLCKLIGPLANLFISALGLYSFYLASACMWLV